MQVYETGSIRNIALAGHSGAGKTSLLESMLFRSGYLNRLGSVDQGTATTDYLPEEIKRKVTISSALAPVEWNHTKLNFIDTPGYADFIGEFISATQAVDSLLMVLCGISGIEVQTEVIWDYAEKQKLPRMIFINKLERENSCFETVVERLREKYGTGIVPLQLPMGKEADFKGMIDLLNGKAYEWKDGIATEIPIPEEYKEEYESQRTYLIEVAAESCDELLLKYLDGQDPTNEEIAAALRTGIRNADIFPVVGGSVEKDMELTSLMDFCVQLLPHPDSDADEVPRAHVYKTLADPFVGKLSFLRISDGTFSTGSGLYNVNAESDEKVANFIIPHGKQQDTVDTVHAGDLICIAKLQNTRTGDTLTVKGNTVEAYPAISYPRANLTYAIRPKSRDDDDKLSNALGRILDEDPSLVLSKNAETGETLLSGVGETHLDVVKERFLNKFGVDVELSPAQIPYRETIRKKVEVQGKHKKQSGGAGQYGDVWLRLEPYPDEDFLFSEEVFGGAVPKNYFPAVEKGVQEAMRQGILAGFPLGNIKVTLYDGSYHPVDSNEMAFKIAASSGFKKGAAEADPVLLEPFMDLFVTVPDSYMGDIMGDFNSRRGRILGMDASEDHKNMQVIHAQAPMAEVQKYTIDLKAMTQGRGYFSMELDHYEPVPQKLAEKIIAEHNQN